MNQKKKGREDFNNVNECSPYSKTKLYRSHGRVFLDHHIINTSGTYQKFLNDQFDQYFKDQIPKLRALKNTGDQYAKNNRVQLLELNHRIQSPTRFRKSFEIIYKDFENQPLIKLIYNYSKRQLHIVDYIRSSYKPIEKIIKKSLSNQSFYAGIRAQKNGINQWSLTYIGIGDLCYPLTDYGNFLDRLGSINMICDSQSRFKVDLRTYFGFFEPKLQPKIKGFITKKIQSVSPRPYKSVVYRPKSMNGYYSLGDYGYRDSNHGSWHRNITNPGQLVLQKGPYVKTPKTLTHQWDNYGGKYAYGPTAVYRQNNFTEDGHQFHCLGDFVRKANAGYPRGNIKPASDHPHVCVRSDCLEINNGSYIKLYGDHGSSAELDGAAFSYYFPGSSAAKNTKNKIGYPGHYLMSFKRHYGSGVHYGSLRSANIKKECLVKTNPPPIDSGPIQSTINSKFNLERTSYAQRKEAGILAIRNQAGQTYRKSQEKAQENQKFIQTQEENYQKTTQHNQEMDKRKQEYTSRNIFLTKLKNQLTRAQKNQETANQIVNNTDQLQKQYYKLQEDNLKKNQGINDQREEEAKKAVKNVNYAINLQIAEAKKPENSAKLFT